MALATALGLVLLATVAPATAAFAQAANPPPVQIDTPTNSNTQNTQSVSINGLVNDPLPLKLSVVVVRNGQVATSCDDDFDFSDPKKAHPCGDQAIQLGKPTPFSFQTNLAYNGPYTATVTETNVVNPNVASRDFKVAAPPAKPANVKAVSNPDRSVTVSWSANKEPDLIGYDVTRTNTDGSNVGIGSTDAKATSIIDHDAAKGGGLLRYTVTAKRPDGDGKTDKPVTAQSVANIVLPVSGGGPPAALLPAIGKSNGSSGTTKAPPTTAEPDNGFSSTLPFAPGAASNGGKSLLALPGDSGGSSNTRSLLVPLAAGLFLVVAACQMRWLNRRLRHPAEPLYLPAFADDPPKYEATTREMAAVGQGPPRRSAPYDHSAETWGPGARR